METRRTVTPAKAPLMKNFEMCSLIFVALQIVTRRTFLDITQVTSEGHLVCTTRQEIGKILRPGEQNHGTVVLNRGGSHTQGEFGAFKVGIS